MGLDLMVLIGSEQGAGGGAIGIRRRTILDGMGKLIRGHVLGLNDHDVFAQFRGKRYGFNNNARGRLCALVVIIKGEG